MDLTSILGIAIGIAFTLYGILSAGSILNFFDLPSVYIVLGGTIGVVILSCPKENLKNFFKLLKITFSNKNEKPIETITHIVELSQLARKEGLLALENSADELDDLFFKKGLLLAVDGLESQMIRHVLEAEIDSLEQRHSDNRRLFDTASIIFPAFGMIGTLIGLINMLQDLTSPDSIGPQMAVALVTTFYGSVMSNLVCIPISKKLQAKTEQEILTKQLIIEGIISIQSGENTRLVEQKLLSFITPSQRKSVFGGDDYA